MRRSHHGPGLSLLRRVHRAVTVSQHTGVPVDEVIDRQREGAPGVSRRGVIAGVTAASIPWRRGRAEVSRTGRQTAPRVIIVGAGLAGLSCAVSLWRTRNIAASVHEWNSVPGGRVRTLRGFFAGDLVAEWCGEFISSEHRRMRALAARYGLTLWNTYFNYGSTNDTGWFLGRRYSERALAQDWQAFGWQLFRDAVEKAPGASWQHATPTARAWDHLSVTEWVDRYVPGGVDGAFGRLCLADTISENGSPAERQSALNLIYLLGYDTSAASGFQPRDVPLVAGTDETYQVAGGNDQIVTGLAGELPAGSITLESRLLAVRETAGRRLVCTFRQPSGTVDVAADHVVLAIPPTTLRQVDLSGIALAPVQRRAIAGATLGSNAKIYLQVAGRPWIRDGYDGSLLTDEAICGGWDAANTQRGGYGPGAQGLWVDYLGGEPGARLAERYGLMFGQPAGAAPAAMVADVLAEVEPIYPGFTAAWQAGPRIAFANDPNISPFLLGAYSNFQVGQYTSFGGAQGLPAGNVHFAGEHTSVAFQGFMEGAVESGLRAAGEIG